MTYGNGDYINYAYDRLGRTTEKEIVSGSSTHKINYVYNGDGQLHSVKDGSTAYGYTYDTLGRLVGTTLKNGTSLTQQSWRQFDDNNRLTGLSVNLPGIGEYSESYVYNSDSTDNISDGTLTQKSLFSGDLLRYTYDSLTRLTQCSIGLLSQEITYCSGTSGQTTALPAQQLIKDGNGAVIGSYSYTYDAVGNITQLQYKPIGAAAGKRTASYTYDELNQLTSAYLPGVLGSSAKSYTYTYDGFGNLLTATSNGVTHTYEYTDSDWGDLLTCYDGEEISYDAIGNPDIYYNGDMMCWSGRQLLERRNGQENTTYSYNADGLRTRRVLTDRSYYESYWLGELLIAETYKKSNGALVYTLVFSYDENGSPVGVSMRNGTSATWTSYDYLKNLQGDILGICSVSGGGIVTIHAAYEYDPWGKLLGVRNNSGGVISDETSIALRNPLRYRGYYYDSDTGYYYLKSRYYDPQIGRFINADGYASTGQGFLGYNMFAYCLNNPILCADEGGNAANPRYNVSLICDGFFKQPSTASSSVENSAPAGSFFGAEASYTFQQKYERELAPQFVNMVISCKSGTSTSTILASSGDSSRPLSVYAQGRADNEILSSAGLKINIANFTLNVSIGADNLGVSASIADHGTIKSIALTADISQFKIGGEFATTVWDSATSEKIYTNISVSGWLFVAAYIYYRTGEWYSTPTSTFG